MVFNPKSCGAGVPGVGSIFVIVKRPFAGVGTAPVLTSGNKLKLATSAQKEVDYNIVQHTVVESWVVYASKATTDHTTTATHTYAHAHNIKSSGNSHCVLILFSDKLFKVQHDRFHFT